MTMKRLGSAIMVITIVGALSGCSKTLSGTYLSKNDNQENRSEALEETIKKQEEEINQLRSKIREQQEEIERLKPKKATEDKNEAIKKALVRKWQQKKVCTNVEVSDETAKIYFCGILNAVFFLENPDTLARQDLDLFIKKTGRETGTIEYYTPPPSKTKIFSISGDLSRAETKTYNR